MTVTSYPTTPSTESPTWTCWRCGIHGFSAEPREDRTCSSCRLVLSEPNQDGRIRYYDENGVVVICKTWLGDYDRFDRPMRDGELYKPGVRTCGHSDCVVDGHIVPASTYA